METIKTHNNACCPLCKQVYVENKTHPALQAVVFFGAITACKAAAVLSLSIVLWTGQIAAAAAFDDLETNPRGLCWLLSNTRGLYSFLAFREKISILCWSIWKVVFLMTRSSDMPQFFNSVLNSDLFHNLTLSFSVIHVSMFPFHFVFVFNLIISIFGVQ